MNGREYLIHNLLTNGGESSHPAQLADTGWCGGGGVAARFTVSHDGASLRVLMEAREREPRGTVTDPLGDLTGDSCLGLILAPAGDSRYLRFEFNPLGTMGLSLGTGRCGRVRMSPNSMAQFNILPFREGEVWGVMFRIPLEFIRLFFPDFALSGRAGGGVFKCGELTARRHYLVWPELEAETPDLTRRENFGTFIFQ